MATRDLTRRFAELRVLRHGADGAGLETKRPGDAFSESGLLDVSRACGQPFALCTLFSCRKKPGCLYLVLSDVLASFVLLGVGCIWGEEHSKHNPG